MSSNNYRPHVLVLPEDDAYRQMANGFLLHDAVVSRTIQVLPIAGGWSKVREALHKVHLPLLEKFYPNRFLLLLVDFDDVHDRREAIVGRIPMPLAAQVFVLGVSTEAEDLRREIGSFERIGIGLAAECYHGQYSTWNHGLLLHNASDLNRMNQAMRPVLFRP